MESVVTYVFFGAAALLAALDVVRPARKGPAIRLWRLSGALLFASSFVVAGWVAARIDPWLAAHRLIDATGLGVVGGAVVGFLALELAIYGWHRALHRVPLLWRFHQTHHSAERIDVYGAYYFHPVDIALFTVVSTAALVMVVGVRVEAALIASLAANLLGLFQHANLRTPRWLGYLVQRPESHSIHHQRGVHAFNYSDLPLWDLVFGTFRNPARFAGESGFYDGASRRLPELLVGLDVTAPRRRRDEVTAELPARAA